MKNFILIPARLDSSRLHQKMLLKETGKPLIQHTYENAKRVKGVDGVYVVTPNKIIKNVCHNNNLDCIYLENYNTTCGTHACLIAAVTKLEPANIVNIQGDSPDVDICAINYMFRYMFFNHTMCSLYYSSKDEEKAFSTSRVKMVTNENDDIMYYSRLPVPYGTDEWKIHVGAYGFPSRVASNLFLLYDIPKKPYNKEEDLEQLLWLEKGYKSHAVKCRESYSIDTREDYELFKRDYFSKQQPNSS